MKKIESQNSEKFQLLLISEFERRSSLNKKYSLRAFAKSLNIDASYLSKLIKGNRALTKDVILKLGSKLGLSSGEIKFFLHASQGKKQKISFSNDLFRGLEEDQFALIANWYHYAILEIVQLDNFIPDINWIAEKLNLTPNDVGLAVDRLVRLGLLSVEGKKWRCTGANTTVKNQFTVEAFKKLQRDILSQAKEALNTESLEFRDQSAMTFCIDESRIPEAKKMIQQFRRELCHFLETGSSKDRVYQLSISLFPVSKK